VAQWIAFSVYTVHIGGWGENMSGAALWFRVGFWTSLAERGQPRFGHGIGPLTSRVVDVDD
jgi:hypothetical protein